MLSHHHHAVSRSEQVWEGRVGVTSPTEYWDFPAHVASQGRNEPRQEELFWPHNGMGLSPSSSHFSLWNYCMSNQSSSQWSLNGECLRELQWVGIIKPHFPLHQINQFSSFPVFNIHKGTHVGVLVSHFITNAQTHNLPPKVLFIMLQCHHSFLPGILGIRVALPRILHVSSLAWSHQVTPCNKCPRILPQKCLHTE